MAILAPIGIMADRDPPSPTRKENFYKALFFPVNYAFAFEVQVSDDVWPISRFWVSPVVIFGIFNEVG